MSDSLSKLPAQVGKRGEGKQTQHSHLSVFQPKDREWVRVLLLFSHPPKELVCQKMQILVCVAAPSGRDWGMDYSGFPALTLEQHTYTHPSLLLMTKSWLTLNNLPRLSFISITRALTLSLNILYSSHRTDLFCSLTSLKVFWLYIEFRKNERNTQETPFLWYLKMGSQVSHCF